MGLSALSRRALGRGRAARRASCLVEGTSSVEVAIAEALSVCPAVASLQLDGGQAGRQVVRLRTKVTKGPGSKAAGRPAMAYELIEAAQTRCGRSTPPTSSPWSQPVLSSTRG